MLSYLPISFIQGSSGPDSQEEREEDSDTVPNPKPEEQLNTVTSTMTMQEYFAQRMAKIKKAQGTCDPAISSNTPSPLATSASMEDSPNTSDMEQSKKKKRKKKDRKGDQDGTVEKVEEDALTSVIGSVEEPSYTQKKKKNKRKREERKEDGAEKCSTPTVMDGATEEEAPKTGKKKISLEVHTDQHKTIEIENTDSKVSDKKKRREQDEEEGAIDKVMPKKNKKKQKK